MTDTPHPAFASIPRLLRDMVVTEKIDGTNALVSVSGEGVVRAGIRTRWITPESDNFGFAAWVRDNEESLRTLGPGLHFGEWWGRGIQRGYGLDERRFSLFNVWRWNESNVPPCCHVVPVLYRGDFCTAEVKEQLAILKEIGSYAAPGFMQPEGLVVFHAKSGQLFKVTLDKNDGHKGAQ